MADFKELASKTWLSTPVLADALQSLGYSNGQTLLGLYPINKAAKTTCLIGSVLPVQALEGSSLFVHLAIYGNIRNKVIIVKTGDPFYDRCAFLGDIQALTASLNGCAGIIVDGYVRDVAGLDSVAMPIWSRGLCPNVGTKLPVGCIGESMRIGETIIEPDDVVVADQEGIVVIPRLKIDLVYQKASDKNEKDELRREKVRNFDFAALHEDIAAYKEIMTAAVREYVEKKL